MAAMAAKTGHACDDGIADLDIGDAGSHGFDDAAAFVAEDHRKRVRVTAAPIGQIGMAQARNDGSDQHLVRRSEEHTSELQSLMRISYAVFCLKKKKQPT